MPSDTADLKSRPIHWLLQIQSDLPEDTSWLSPAETGKLEGFRFAKRRGDWLLGRWTAKRLLAGVLRISRRDWPLLEIIAAPDGAPEPFYRGVPADAAVSISHSEGTGFCAAATGAAVGCDIEIVAERQPEFLLDYFTPEEREFCAEARGMQPSCAATLIWSAKESALKALREGLRRDTRSVVVQIENDLKPLEWNALKVRCLESGASFEGWWQLREWKVLTVLSRPSPSELRPW
jgi:4'-phosphopantetheinyl transferase